MIKHFWPNLFSVFCVAFLAACGGGGSSGGSNDPKPNNSAAPSINATNAMDVLGNTVAGSEALLRATRSVSNIFHHYVFSGGDLSEVCAAGGSIDMQLLHDAEPVGIISSGDNIAINYNECFDENTKGTIVGQTQLTIDTIAISSIYEFRITGALSLPESIRIASENNAVEITGNFSIAYQTTESGESIIAQAALDDSATVTTQGNVDSFTNFDIQKHTDWDRSYGSHNLPEFYLKLKLDIYSESLGSSYSCTTPEQWGGSYNVSEVIIWKRGTVECSGQKSKAKFSTRTGSPSAGGGQIAAVDSTGNGEFETLQYMPWSSYIEEWLFETGEPFESFVEFVLPEIQAESIAISSTSVVYAPNKQRIYAASSIESGNEILVINSSSRQVTERLALTEKPTTISLSSDETVLYVGYSTEPRIDKFLTEDLALSASIAIEPNEFSLEERYPIDIAVSPVDNNVIAVATSPAGAVAGETILINNGVVLADEIRLITDEFSKLIFSSDGQLVYGLATDSTSALIGFIDVLESGLQMAVARDGFLPADDFGIQKGVIFTSSGQALDISSRLPKGSVKPFTWWERSPDDLLLSPDSSRYYLVGKNNLEVHNSDSFTFKSSYRLALDSSPHSLIELGDGTIVAATDTSLYFLDPAKIQDYGDPECRTESTSHLLTKETSWIAKCYFYSAIYDKTRDKVYASIPGVAGSLGNSIAVINAVTAEIESLIPVGSDPDRLAISHDDAKLYVGLNGESAIAEIDLFSQTIIRKYSLGFSDKPEDLSGYDYDRASTPLLAEDIEVFPDNPDAIVVSTYKEYVSARFEELAVYYSGTKAPIVADGNQSNNRIAFGADSSTLYATNNETTEFGFREFEVSASGIVEVKSYAGLLTTFGSDFAYFNSKIYSTGGSVVNPESGVVESGFPQVETSDISSLVAIDEQANDIFYFFDIAEGYDPIVRIFDLTDHSLKSEIELPRFNSIFGHPEKLLVLGNGRLGLLKTTGLVIYDRN